MGESLTQKVLDGDWTNLKDDFETVIAKKITNKINAQKKDFMDKAQGIEPEPDEKENEED